LTPIQCGVMYRVLNLATPPAELTGYLQATLEPGGRLRRRAVLTRQGGSEWTLVCCTVEGLPHANQGSGATPSRRYPDAILFEDWPTASESRQFIDNIQAGRVAFGDIIIERKGTPNWQTELHPRRTTSWRALVYA
jgi:hypothetical protein